MTTFLVDILESDKLGMAISSEKIAHNLQLIGNQYYKDVLQELENSPAGETIQFVACGRYMAVIILYKIAGRSSIIFIDTENNPDRALDACLILRARGMSDSNINYFMEEFEKMKPHYNDNYNSCQLFVESGEAFN